MTEEQAIAATAEIPIGLTPVPEATSVSELNAEESKSPLFKRTMQAFVWRFLSEFSKVFLRLAVMVVLAHLLPVEAFGVLALAMIVINFAYEIFEMGMMPAVIQREELTPTHIRTAFMVSWIGGLVITAAIWFGAPLIGVIFRSEEVIPVVRLIGLSFLFTSLGAISWALMQRRMEYRRLMWIDLTSYGLGYAFVGILLAWFGYGVWALAWAALVQSFIRMGLVYAASPHSIKPIYSKPEMRELLNFGLGMSLSRIANLIAINGDNFVIGRWLGAAPLGLYSRAYQIVSMPKYQFSSVMDEVLFPAYSSIQNESERLGRAYMASISICAILSLPMLAAMAIVAPEVMGGIFGAEWIGAALPMQILCIGGALRSVYGLGDSIARAKGAVYLASRCHGAYAVCVLGGSAIGSKWGVNGVAVGVVAASLVMYLMIAQLGIRLTGISWRGFLSAQLPGLLLTAAVLALAWPVALLMRSAQLPWEIVLVITLATAGVAFFGAALLLPQAWLNDLTMGTFDKLKLRLLQIIGAIRGRLKTA